MVLMGASTCSALVTQEGAPGSPEIHQGSPRQKCRCQWVGEYILEHRSLWKDRSGAVMLIIPGVLGY